MKKLLLLLMMIFVSYGIAYADGFTNESFQGNYAGKAIFGANDSCTIGMMFMDGNGNITGSGITNAPALLSFRRNVIPGTFSGTYDINPDGTGTFTLTVTIGDGLSSTEHINMVVMRAEVVDGIKLITEGFGASLEGTKPILGKPGGMVTFTATRLPD